MSSIHPKGTPSSAVRWARALLVAVGLGLGCGSFEPGDDDSAGGDDDLTPVEFEPVASGVGGLDEADYAACTKLAAKGIDCCTYLNLELIQGQERLDERYAAVTHLPDVPPTVDFTSHVALLSYTTKCGSWDLDLAVDAVWLDGASLRVEETLREPASSIADVGRPWNLVRIPSGEYDDLSGELTYIHESY